MHSTGRVLLVFAAVFLFGLAGRARAGWVVASELLPAPAVDPLLLAALDLSGPVDRPRADAFSLNALSASPASAPSSRPLPAYTNLQHHAGQLLVEHVYEQGPGFVLGAQIVESSGAGWVDLTNRGAAPVPPARYRPQTLDWSLIMSGRSMPANP